MTLSRCQLSDQQLLGRTLERFGMQIKGLGTLTPEQVDSAVATGGRFVVYEYCISLLFITLRQQTEVVLLASGELGVLRGLPYSAISILLGWWGLPWGLIYTPLSLINNLRGGANVTPEVQAWVHANRAEAAPMPV